MYTSQATIINSGAGQGEAGAGQGRGRGGGRGVVNVNPRLLGTACLSFVQQYLSLFKFRYSRPMPLSVGLQMYRCFFGLRHEFAAVDKSA